MLACQKKGECRNSRHVHMSASSTLFPSRPWSEADQLIIIMNYNCFKLIS